MPESCQHPYHQQIKNRAKFPSSAASQRNIDIPAEPLPQCHMPSAVKIPDPPGHIRSVEISGQFDSQHSAKPHCHQRISPEIKIDLHGISNGCQPCQRSGDTLESGYLYFMPQDPYAVGQQHFGCQSYDEQLHAVLQSLHSKSPVVQAVFHLTITGNRAGDQLRKHDHISCKF